MRDHGVAMGEFEQPILAGADASPRVISRRLESPVAPAMSEGGNAPLAHKPGAKPVPSTQFRVFLTQFARVQILRDVVSQSGASFSICLIQ